MEQAVGLQLGRDPLDGSLDVGGLPGVRADGLPVMEEEVRRLRRLDAVDEAGELLRLVFGSAQGEDDRLEVQLPAEGCRRDDVLDAEGGEGRTSGGRCGAGRRGRAPQNLGGALCTVVRVARPGSGSATGLSKGSIRSTSPLDSVRRRERGGPRSITVL